MLANGASGLMVRAILTVLAQSANGSSAAQEEPMHDPDGLHEVAYVVVAMVWLRGSGQGGSGPGQKGSAGVPTASQP